MTGINFVTTVLKMRCPGMSYLRMPIFCWTVLASSLIIVAVFPILTATLAMLSLDRYFGWHFFTADAGGNPMMFMNLIWAWGHPEVYILVLPAFGIFSEVFSTFSGKPLFGYRSMVAATLFICIVSMMTWLHHFFTMGAGPAVNTAFGISTSVIAVGTGVKIYNWIFTMYGGRVRFSVPMLWSLGFIFTFVIGGMTGVCWRCRRPTSWSTIRCSWSPTSTTSSSAASSSRCSPGSITGSPRRSASGCTRAGARPPSGSPSSASG
jgi:cytochrome o ubiquinol oxidase subunit 1